MRFLEIDKRSTHSYLLEEENAIHEKQVEYRYQNGRLWDPCASRDETGVYAEIDALAAMAPKAAVALRTDGRANQLAAAQAGLGIAVLAHHVAVGSGLIQLEAPPLPTREIWLVQHKDTRHVPRIRAVAEVLVAKMHSAARFLAGRDHASCS